LYRSFFILPGRQCFSAQCFQVVAGPRNPKNKTIVLEYELHKKEKLKKKSYAELRQTKKKRKSHLQNGETPTAT
jgi:hypothetical protein